MVKVRKAVIAAAGFGTRFLPQTKALPKEMLPIVDKPIIQHIVEELVSAGIEDIIIVTGYHKRSIEDHFDHMSADLRQNLRDGNKLELLEETKKISNLANFAYIRQKGPYGTATPLVNAKHLLGNEPFIYTWGDDFIQAKPTRFRQLIDLYEETSASIVPCIEVQSDEGYDRYGIISGKTHSEGVLKMDGIVEKPGVQSAPSNLASVGGYLFSPEVHNYLHADTLVSSIRGEAEIQPIMQKMIDDGHGFYALKVQNGKYYDTGNKLEYLKTVVDFALMHEDIKKEFQEYLASLVKAAE
jgi:UTP--glucose-1-phosphate uridylyltransferase